MILTFHDEGSEDVYNGRDTRKARKACPPELWRKAQMKLQMIRNAKKLSDLRAPPGNRLEPLERDRQGQHSIRINDRYRICFRWTDAGAERVEIVDYH
ncbi:MAG TPA: type II toxin-antitoxin system RelE/ParE family toxin [Longimicrobiaceae bacterium]|nr:type II toxin-antitoxin system RelE/ParE family toxin [Longimicrobiaceae bacterium]